jgi:hypothetical protein
MATIIVFDKETTLRVDETIEEAVHQLSEASRGGRFALVHQADQPHHVNPAAVAYVTEAALGSGPMTAS